MPKKALGIVEPRVRKERNALMQFALQQVKLMDISCAAFKFVSYTFFRGLFISFATPKWSVLSVNLHLHLMPMGSRKDGRFSKQMLKAL